MLSVSPSSSRSVQERYEADDRFHDWLAETDSTRCSDVMSEFRPTYGLHGIFLIYSSANLNNALRRHCVSLSEGLKKLWRGGEKCGIEKFWHISVCLLG